MKGNRHILRKLIWALGFVAVVYLAGANFFINAVLPGIINTDVQSLLIRYRYAITPFPGVAFVKTILVRSADPGVQFTIDFDHAWVVCNLFRLKDREFHVKKVSVDDLAFRLRFVKEEKEITPEITQLLPPLEGLPSFKKPPKDPNEQPTDTSKLWRIRFDDIHITNVKEIWFEKYRYLGNLAIDGGFYLWPQTEVEIFPSSLRTKSGEVLFGKNRFAGPIKGDLAFQVRRFLPKEADGLKPFDYSDVSLKLHLPISNIAFLNFYTRELSWLKLDRGEGELDAALEIKNGAFVPGSNLKLETDHLELALFENDIIGNAKVEWKVDEETGKLALRFNDYRFIPRRLNHAAIKGKALSIDVVTSQLQISKSFSPMQFHLDMPKATLSDLGYANAYLPKASEFALKGGEAEVHAKFSVSTDPNYKDHGQFTLRAKQAEARYKDLDFSSDLDVDVKLAGGKVFKGKMDFTGTKLRISKLKGDWVPRGLLNNDIPWWSQIDVQKGHVSLEDPVLLRGKIAFKGRDALPFMYLFLPKENPDWMKDILRFENFKANASIFIDDDALTLDRAIINGDEARIRGWFRKNSNFQEGKVLLEKGVLAAGLQIEGKKVSIRLQDAISWFVTNPPPPVEDLGTHVD